MIHISTSAHRIYAPLPQVFDKRVALDPELNETATITCFKCRQPLTIVEQASEEYVVGESCPYCHGKANGTKAAPTAGGGEASGTEAEAGGGEDGPLEARMSVEAAFGGSGDGGGDAKGPGAAGHKRRRGGDGREEGHEEGSSSPLRVRSGS